MFVRARPDEGAEHSRVKHGENRSCGQKVEYVMLVPW